MGISAWVYQVHFHHVSRFIRMDLTRIGFDEKATQ